MNAAETTAAENSLESLSTGLTLLLVFLLIIVVLLIVIDVLLFRQVGTLKKKYRSLMKDDGGRSIEKGLLRRLAQIDSVSDEQGRLKDEFNIYRAVQDRSLVKYGIVKYDAFEDVGGKMSFALALLDKSDTGFVLNAQRSREQCFVYIKEIVNGESYIMLSDEEIQALRDANRYGTEEDIINEYRMNAGNETV